MGIMVVIVGVVQFAQKRIKIENCKCLGFRVLKQAFVLAHKELPFETTTPRGKSSERPRVLMVTRSAVLA